MSADIPGPTSGIPSTAILDSGLAPGLALGDDGLVRCAWSAKDAEYRRYHDEEWGTALHGDQPLFEKLSLEGFQAGLSWITILKRRPAFRELFAGFDINTVASFGDDDVERLMAQPLIIRNRQKILATISNARIARDLVGNAPGTFNDLMWSFAPRPHPHHIPRVAGGIPATTAESTALSTALRSRGFRFVGPTTMYALMQSAGMVDDHLDGCWRSGGA
ncbi:MAG: hypothetical protein JWQ43_1602 [Glaciihabitans sp.]|nr:hypothetical protein [Glaciihabitans sp.]